MRWEAANVKTSAIPEEERGNSNGRNKSTETVEAALARLTRSYSAAMNCIGSLQRLLVISDKRDGDDDKEERLESMQRVADAARSTLERTILIDPLIAETYAPTWYQVVKQLQTEQEWSFVRQRRPPPNVLLSSSHQSTVKELAYLSLVNYADLLVKAVTPIPYAEGILDRGVIPAVPRLRWYNDLAVTTQRLAVAALCDASDLDGTDPTVWLKLACATRRLSVVSGESHDRLERHALERGRMALPSDVPPNRLIVKALAEHYRDKEESRVRSYPSKLHRHEDTPSILIDLPRYSWSTLGRLLLRACREGSAYRANHTVQQKPFGSPRVVLKLSPMLALPSEVLGTVCQYLDKASIRKFEATCRALSASILAARVSMERRDEGSGTLRQKETTEGPSNEAVTNETVTITEPPSVERSGSPSRQTSTGTNSSDAASRAHRTSKRVQSQLITSCKLAERKAKRNSVEFCLLAALFGCTSEDDKYKSALEEKVNWDVPVSLQIGRDPSPLPWFTKSPSKLLRENVNARARLGDVSLTAFIEKWTSSNSGPMDVLSRYLIHIAMNVEDCFTVDPDSAVILPPLIIEGIDALLQRSGSHQGLDPSWYGTRTFSPIGNIREYIEVISLNLLNAELRLRMCERAGFSNNGYDDDGTVLSVLVPDLFRASNEIETTFPHITEDRKWLSLKARLHWLASGFYLWWSRISQTVRESREAESRGLEHVGEAIRTLGLPRDQPIQSLRTPQLESPSRSEQHWKIMSESTLSAFRDELQASFVVSIARERFMEQIGEMEQRVTMLREEDSKEMTDDEKVFLSRIGADLLSRYGIPAEGTNQKLSELFDDFLEINGDRLLRIGSVEETNSQQRFAHVWDLLPSELPPVNEVLFTSSPSILSVLCTCMQTMDGSCLSLLSFLSHLTLVGFQHLKDIQRKETGSISVENTLHDGDAFSDSEASFSSADEGENTGKNSEEARMQQGARAVQFLLEKTRDIYEKNAESEDLSTYVSSEECHALVQSSLAFAADWYAFVTDKVSVLTTPIDMDVFFSIQNLVKCMLSSNASKSSTRSLETAFFVGLARIVVKQRQTFPSILRPSGKRMGRAVRQKVCLNRAEYISAIASEMAYMLSKAPSELRSNSLCASYLLRDNMAVTTSPIEEGESTSSASMSRLASFTESLQWLWKYMAAYESDGVRTVRLSDYAGGSSFDRPIIEVLYPPIASLLIGLCGSATVTRRRRRHESAISNTGTDSLCISEFYDSDASATDLIVGDNGENTGILKSELLRCICHASHCIALVSRELNTKIAISYQPPSLGGNEHGPLLPIVASRVSNHFADILLSEFGEQASPDKKQENVWAPAYPYGVRSIGGLIDFTLSKVYRALHGFVITGEKCQQPVEGMEHLSLTSNVDTIPSHVAKPESILAAAQLYRYILRASAASRRSPPREALECVSSALPALAESERSQVIRSFLFSGRDYFLQRDVVALLSRGAEQVQSKSALPDWIWEMKYSSGNDNEHSGETNGEVEDVMLVRRGICHELAQGPLPSLSVSSADGARGAKSNARDGILEERVLATSYEEELSKKFTAIVDDLCYGDPVNSKGWYDAAQCLSMKADLIADRVGLSRGFARAKDFYVPKNRGGLESSMSLAELMHAQEKEFERNSQGWIPYLGKDLSVYIDHQWASFESLLECSDKIKSEYGDASLNESQIEEEDYAGHVLKEISVLYDKGDYVGWQQAWGGLFVGALHKMSLRCMFIAMEVLRQQEPAQTQESHLTSEIAESLGVSYYRELMGSQMYGYPMHVMTDYHKRQLAETALACFQFAIDSLSSATSTDCPNASETWDLVFMKGKCHEKIASTYKKEKFPRLHLELKDGGEPTRAYERHMKQALLDYATSYEDAKAIRDQGGFGDIHEGGSSHGPVEAFYRLHASRLKCLLSAVRQRQVDRHLAESEALRLTLCHWFHQPSVELERRDIRACVWTVLADVVSAMAQCRVDHQFFHRSVYRHAQALMWAPVLHDPGLGFANADSLGSVPVTKGHLLRGLNSTTPSATSAEAIMNLLFERKRPQLCAVWVTTSGSVSQSPFELLNGSSRKYDSLRGKYISAYIDTLRICNRRNKIDELLQAVASAPRDLPSLFQASALRKGAPPDFRHTEESLLVKGRSLVSSGLLQTAKRKANSALAAAILKDILSNDSTTKDETLRAAYACFLRLNCTLDDLRRTRAWKFGQTSMPEVDALCQAFLARKDHADIHADAASSNWIGSAQKTAVLKAAVDKCQDLFPHLPSHVYAKRKAKRTRNKSTDSAPTSSAPTRKRKEPESSPPPPFVVTVPDNLNAGDKFETTVQLQDGSSKKIRLTVPEGKPQKLQFTLAPSASEEASPPTTQDSG